MMANQESPAQDTFIVPVKRIKDEAKDLPYFQTSEAYARIMSYILALNNAVLNRKVSEPIPESNVTSRLESPQEWYFYRNNVLGTLIRNIPQHTTHTTLHTFPVMYLSNRLSQRSWHCWKHWTAGSN
jgi:hypothetical protein